MFKKNSSLKPKQADLLLNLNKKTSFTESIKNIRTNLAFSEVDKEMQVILVTSSQPGDGKSFISANLALAYKDEGKKVLLIDADLRLGRLHKIFNISNKRGLSNLILNYDDDTKYESYIQKTDVNGLFVIPRGIVPPNPAELLGSKKFDDILHDLKRIFDYIILDATPINGLSDALVLTKNANEVVIVCKYGKTDLGDLEECKKALLNADAKIAGVVINSMPKTKNKYGYYTE